MPDITDLGVQIRRDVRTTLYPFTDYFSGFDKIPGILALFGSKTNEVLRNLKVEFYSSKFGYMQVSEEDGHIIISSHHLRTAESYIIYLDLFHELHHVKQFIDGKKIFLSGYDYVDSPIEIEAYLPTVEEARRIGLNEQKIREYLKIEWIDDEQYERFLKRMGVATS